VGIILVSGISGHHTRHSDKHRMGNFWTMSPVEKGDGLICADNCISQHLCLSRFFRQLYNDPTFWFYHIIGHLMINQEYLEYSISCTDVVKSSQAWLRFNQFLHPWNPQFLYTMTAYAGDILTIVRVQHYELKKLSNPSTASILHPQASGDDTIKSSQTEHYGMIFARVLTRWKTILNKTG